MAKITLCANPYDTSAPFWYFDTLEQYREKAAKAKNRYGEPVEEFEMMFLDGSTVAYELFKVMKVNQANLGEFFDVLDNYTEDDIEKASYLMDELHLDFDESIERIDEVTFITGGLGDYLADQHPEYADASWPSPLAYIDWDRFAQDHILNGDFVEYAHPTLGAVHVPAIQ